MISSIYFHQLLLYWYFEESVHGSKCLIEMLSFNGLQLNYINRDLFLFSFIPFAKNQFSAIVSDKVTDSSRLIFFPKKNPLKWCHWQTGQFLINQYYKAGLVSKPKTLKDPQYVSLGDTSIFYFPTRIEQSARARTLCFLHV